MFAIGVHLQSTKRMSVIRSVAEKERLLLLVRDFNYPKINWDELDGNGDGEVFLDIVRAD